MSVIVDLSGPRPQQMTAPIPISEMETWSGPIPFAIFVGMWTAAWARAERCPLSISAGVRALNLHCAHREPTPLLDRQTDEWAGDIIGCAGFAVPLLPVCRHVTGLTWSWPMGASN
jgi:hypothetical protein